MLSQVIEDGDITWFYGAAATDANITITDVITNNVSTLKHGWTPKLNNVVTDFLNGQGGWSAPAGGGGGNVSATTGSYVGNNTVNRAIPTGAGAVPLFVLIVQGGGAVGYIITPPAASIHYLGNASNSYNTTVPDATNFYVGNAGSYEYSGNGTGITYQWKVFY